ncbi:unnamed protein product, partial [Heterosigma akashiwo]
VQLALSLHAPSQALRRRIVPSARAHPLDKLMDAIDEHLAMKKGRKVLIEYVLLRNVNTSIPIAHELGTLLQGKNVTVNLIPYNPTSVDEEFQPPSDQETEEFRATVASYGLLTTVRVHHGRDIAGACGQLALQRSQDGGGGKVDGGGGGPAR